MADEVVTHSWLGRLGNSIKGILVGIVLFGVSFVLLSWNENRAVKEYRDLKEVQLSTISVDIQSVDPALEGKSIHLSGKAETRDTLRDPDFGVKANAIRLSRNVEMFQWEEEKHTEKKKKAGGKVEETISYTYNKVWASSPISSSSFKQPDGHKNPGKLRFDNWSDQADEVKVGVFEVNRDVLRKFNFSENLRPPQNTRVPDGSILEGGYLYFGETPDTPEIGDHRISFTITPQDVVSIIAGQKDHMLASALLSSGRQYIQVERGEFSLEDMVATAKNRVKILTWILRGVGFLLMGIGLSMVLKPLVVVADVVPFIGNLVGAGVGFIAFATAGVLSCVTIAVAWIAVRPVIGIPLLVVAGGLLYMMWQKKRAATQVSGPFPMQEDAPPPPPPPASTEG